MNKRIIVVALAAAALGLSACGTPVQADKVVSSVGAEASAQASTQAPDPNVDMPTQEPVEEVAEDDSEVDIQTSFTVGETARIGDWEVKVTKVSKPSTKQVKAWNSFNDKAEGQYVMATYTAKYVGGERTADVTSDLSWKFGGSDGQVYDSASVVTEADTKDAPTEARKGGKVKQDAIFDVPSKAIKGGVVTVEGYDADFNQTYADFKM